MLRGAGGTRSSPGQGEHRAGGLPTSPRGSGARPSPALPTRGHPRPSLRIAAAAGASRFRDGAPGQGSIPSAGVGDKGPRETSGFSRHFSQPKRPNGSFNRKNPIPCGSEPKWLLQGHRGGLRQSWELNASVSRASSVLLSPGKQHKPRCEKGMKYFYSSFFFLQMKKIIMQKTFSMQNISF